MNFDNVNQIIFHIIEANKKCELRFFLLVYPRGDTLGDFVRYGAGVVSGNTGVVRLVVVDDHFSFHTTLLADALMRWRYCFMIEPACFAWDRFRK